jgi:hypothetical protein
MSSIKVFCGDINCGKWDFVSILGSCSMTRLGETINLKSDSTVIARLTEEKEREIWGAMDRSIFRSLVLRPLRDVGRAFSSRTKRVSFACELDNGKRFMAATDEETWQKIISCSGRSGSLPYQPVAE